jgi:hypothetical protein
MVEAAVPRAVALSLPDDIPGRDLILTADFGASTDHANGAARRCR